MINELRCSLAPELSDIETLLRMVEVFGKANDLQEPKVYVVNLMLDELVTNLVMHGSANDGALTAHIQLQAGQDGITLTLEDNGQPFDPTPDVEAPLEDRPVGKLGLHFVKSLANQVSYRLENGRNKLTINLKADTEA